MRSIGIIVLAAILLAVLAPQSLELMVRNGHLMIGSLDLCHSAAPALSTSGEMPFIHTASCIHVPVPFTAGSAAVTSLFALFLTVPPEEQPPKVS